MNITDNERATAQRLMKLFIYNKAKFPYANIGTQNEYLGWVTDFRLKDSSNKSIFLDLNNENDLFLLFVLAIAWSRTGPWENAAFLVAYLKLRKKDNFKFWNDKINYKKEQEIRVSSAYNISHELKGFTPRRKLSFRKDIFDSLKSLALNWNQIIEKLEISENRKDFKIFMKFIRNINGLGVGNKRILIKIPLVLRELRCQKIYSNISGDLCCVPDARVLKAGKLLNIELNNVTNIDNLIYCSSKIYKLFGDLYDLPLFAYEDLKNLP